MGLLPAIAAFRPDAAESHAEDRESLRRLAAGDSDAAARLYDVDLYRRRRSAEPSGASSPSAVDRAHCRFEQWMLEAKAQ